VLRFAWAGVIVVAAVWGRAWPPAGDAAVAFERGNGVPRDYTRAVRVYEDRCQSGHGELIACRKLAFLLLMNRGVPHLAIDPQLLLKTACEHGDWLACVPPIVPLDSDKASAACEAGTPAACLAVTWTHAFTQSGTVEDADHERLERACNGAVLEACEELVSRVGNTASDAMTARVQHACDDGDADACAALGHPLANAELCRAHDFRACAETDDPAALDKACTQRISSACEKLAIAARDADPPDPQVAAKYARACALGAAVCTRNWKQDVPIGCDAYHPTRVPAGRRVHLPALTGTDAHGAPWTAPAGRPFLLLGLQRGVTPDRYADVARRLEPGAAVYVIAPAGTDAAPFAPAQLVTLDDASGAAPVAAAGPPDPGSSLDLRVGDAWPTVVDASFTPRAVLSLDSGIVPATLARCTKGLLAEP
jgi:TPR repeat protein